MEVRRCSRIGYAAITKTGDEYNASMSDSSTNFANVES